MKTVQMTAAEPLQAAWSPSLEALADRLRRDIADTPCSPFEKICIIVNDPATENWLKEFLLLDQGKSTVLMQLEFRELPEFLNDWLAALVHGIDPRRRRAGCHPYSPAVLTWRIYRLLGEAAGDERLQALTDYLGSPGDPTRRYALAEQLAHLYDDYQNSRFSMLRNWEKGEEPRKEIPVWQPVLYQKLVKEDPDSYARDYERAFQMPPQLPRWFRHYRAVHVFDIPFMPEPMLRLLEQIAVVIPLKIWCFNPQQEWLAETPSIREAVRKHRRMLESGIYPEPGLPLFDVDRLFDSPEERLFGALASGARAVLWNLCSDVQGAVEVPASEEVLAHLKERRIELHGSCSPRRELEVIRDGLADFFSRNPDCSARDAVILCADWEHYAPVIDSVFGAGKECVPVAVCGGVPGDTPFTQTVRDLLAFRENRFEVGAVFNLLSVPAIREKFGLEESAVTVLREMVKKANIHWGYDDRDVRRCLAIDEPGEGDPAADVYPFTWKRGFARLTAEMLYGFPEEEPTLLEIDQIRNLHPCGLVEGERADCAARLWQLVESLHRLRDTLAPGTCGTAAEMADRMFWLLDTFLAADERCVKELLDARQAVRRVAERLSIAGITTVEADVFTAAVEAALPRLLPGRKNSGNAVRFMPLNTFTATPHQLVWICGLNDGRFPQIERRPSYDLLGKYPSFFDASLRERDAFALLKAVLGARACLMLSYIGKDVHTNETIPPSVLLTDLLEYLEAVHIPVSRHQHPMRAYSRHYFEENADPAADLPRSYSLSDQRVAEALQKRSETAGIVPFPLAAGAETNISLDELAKFLSAPSESLLAMRGANLPVCKYDGFYNREQLAVVLTQDLRKKIALTGAYDARSAAMLVETGKAPDERSASEEILACQEMESVTRALTFKSDLSHYNVIAPDGSAETFAGLYARWLACRPAGAGPDERTLQLTVSGHTVNLQIIPPHRVDFLTSDGVGRIVVCYEGNSTAESVLNRIWLQHLGVNAVSGPVSSFVFGTAPTGYLFLPLPPEEALARLVQVVELVSRPLPPEFPILKNIGGEDRLPAEWQQRLWTKNDYVSTRQSARKRRQA